MAKDFKAGQLRSAKLIGSRSDSSNASLLIYSESKATDQAGSHSAAMVSNVGSDVFLFVSGNIGKKGAKSGVTLFGGDIVVSGTFFAEKMVAEVTSTTTSSHYVSGALFLQRQWSNVNSSDVASSLNQLALYASKSNGVTRLYLRNSAGIKELIGKGDITTFFSSSAAGFLSATGSTSLNGGLGYDYKTSDIGTDVFFFVSGSTKSRNTAVRGAAAFGGDIIVSGSIYNTLGTEITGNVSSVGTPADNQVAIFKSTDTIEGDSKFTWNGSTLIVTGGLDVDEKSFVVNASTNKVGIGTNTPTADLEISGTSGTTRDIQISHKYPRFIMDAGGVYLNSKTYADSAIKKYGLDRVINRYMSGGLGVIDGWGTNHAGAIYQTTVTDAGAHYQIVASASGGSSSPGYLKRVNAFLYHGSKVSGNRGSVMIMSGGHISSLDPANFADTNFFVSGTIGSKDSSVKGTSVFGGDIVFSGSLNGGKKANSAADYPALQIGKFTPSGLGKDVSLFVSGSKLSIGTSKTGTSVFGGDVLISGTLLVGTGAAGGLYVKHTDNKVGIGTNFPSSSFSVAGVADFRKKVGIGTHLPSASLHVVGNTHIVGNLYFTGANTSTGQTRAIHFTAFDKQKSGGYTDSGRIASIADDPYAGSSVLEVKQSVNLNDRVRLFAGQIELKATPDHSSDPNVTGSIHMTGSLRVTEAGVFTLGMSGSLTRLSNGTSFIKAGSNITVASASNGSITISSSGGGGSVTTVSGSTSVGSVTSIDFTKLGLLTNLGSNQIALTGTIGDAEDGSYADGLFTTFASNTPIGTAIDKINEVLGYLSPSPAANLSRIGTSGTAASGGVTALLSFGTSNDREGSSPQYFNVAASAGIASAVDVNGSYQVTTSSNNIRASVFGPSLSVLRGPLADNVVISKYSNNVVNHSGSVFGDGETGTLALTVNGATLKSVDLSLESVGAGDPGFGSQNQLTAGSGFINVSQTGSAVQSNGQSFGLFKNRSANFQIDTAHQRSGWNYARVTHTVGSNTRTTNFVEWVNDNQGTAVTTFNQRLSASLSGSVFVSGIQYATGAGGNYLVDIRNFYDFVYAANTISFSTTNTSISSQTVPTLPGTSGAHLNIIPVTGSWEVTETACKDGTMAGGTVSSNLSVSHPIKANLSSSGSITSGRLLLYKVEPSANNQLEDFVSESHRIISGSYANQAAVTNSSNRWQGNQSLLLNNGLQFFAGKLKAPANTINSGDFRGTDNGGSYFGAGLSKTGNPNYSSITGTRTFYRYFKNESGGAIRDFDIFLTGSGATIVATGSTLGTGNITVMAKGPGASGFVDLHASFAYQSASDGNGGRLGALSSSIANDLPITNHFSFGTASIATNEYIVVKIEAGHGWTGHFSGMNTIFPAVGSTAVTAAPALAELQIDSGTGATGKLSFGSSKQISGYINVTGSTASKGFGTNVDINGAIALSTNAAANKRYGLYGGSTTITGDINGNTSAVTSGDGTSHTADSFKDAHSGSLNLYVNDLLKHTLNLDGFKVAGGNSVNGNGSGFQNIGALSFGADANNLTDYRRSYRTGEFKVVTADQNNGWNWARVDHVVGGSTRTTTYVEWVKDSDSSAVSIPNISSGTFGAAGFYNQSGVKYYDTSLTTVASGTISFKVQHAYNNVYSDSTSGLRLSAKGNLTVVDIGVTGSGIPTTTTSSPASDGVSYPALRTDVSNPHNTDLHVTSSVKYTGGQSLPGTSSPISSLTSRNLTATFAARHPINSDASNSITVSNFLVYSGSSTNSNINTMEKLTGEFYRYASGSYASQSETTGSWDSTLSLAGADAYHNSGLLIYGNTSTNGYLISPSSTRLPASGDFRTTGNLTSPDGNVNYSGITGTRDFYRAFLNNDSSDQANVVITVKGDATIVPRSGAGAGTLGSNKNFFMDVKIPGKTGWMDSVKASDGSIVNGSGALSGDRDTTVDSGGASNTIDFQTAFIGGTASGAEKFIIRIVADAGWTGYITEISVSY
jgi:hypothetical protein